MMNAQKNILFSVFLCVIFAFLFIASSCSREEAVRLGFVGGLSGRVADLGISGRNGAILAIENKNENGGINGRAIDLIVMDDRQDPEVAEKAVINLVDLNVDAIIGHMTSSMSTWTIPIINKRKITMVSPTTSTTDLSGRDDYFIRVCATTDQYAAKMAGYLYNQVGMAKVSLIYDQGNRAYTENWMSHFGREFKRLGGTVAHQEIFHSGPETHFLDITRKALIPGIDGVIISANALDTAMICQQAKKLGLNIPIAVSEWSATEKLIDFGGIAVEGVIVSQFFNRYNTDPAYLNFREKYVHRFGTEPGFPSVAAYDAVNLVLTALEKGANRTNLKKHIIEMHTFNGVQGNLTINRFGDTDKDTYISIIKDGKFIMAEQQR